jgi:hypothetical protein
MSNTNLPDVLNLSQVEEENIRVVRRFFEAADTGDTSKVHEFIDPEWVNPESQANPRLANLHGPEAFIKAIKTLRSTFADVLAAWANRSIRSA